jgi:hypothetical protein
MIAFLFEDVARQRANLRRSAAHRMPDARVGLQRSRDSSVGKASDRIPVKGDADFSSASESL